MTGGAMANFVGLKCARDQRLGIEVRERGVRGAGPVALYASEEAHVVIRRAADMLGLGADAVRAIAVDGEQRMRVDALAAALARDVADGVLPLAVWPRPARRRPARSTRCRRSRRSRASTARGSTSTPRTAARSCSPTRCAPLLAGHGARRLDRRRPAQVDVHAAVGRLRARARLRRLDPLLPRRRLLHLARRGGPPGRRLRHARPAVLARVRGAEGLGLAARPRPRRLRPADRARRRARPLPRRARRGAPRVGADVPAAALDLLLPPPPGRLDGHARRSSTATTSG